MKVFEANGGRDRLMIQIAQGNTAELYDIVVFTERRKGIGTQLLKQAEDYLKQAGIKRLFAFTRDINPIARQFYEKNGFKSTFIPLFYPDSNAILYVKEL